MRSLSETELTILKVLLDGTRLRSWIAESIKESQAVTEAYLHQLKGTGLSDVNPFGAWYITSTGIAALEAARAADNQERKRAAAKLSDLKAELRRHAEKAAAARSSFDASELEAELQGARPQGAKKGASDPAQPEPPSCPALHKTLCYVEGPWAYFSPLWPKDVQGEDWGKAPYRTNASAPKEGQGVVKVGWEGPFLGPDDCWAWPPGAGVFSVDDVNGGKVPWLLEKLRGGDERGERIFAGTPLIGFIKRVRKAGGQVYLTPEVLVEVAAKSLGVER